MSITESGHRPFYETKEAIGSKWILRDCKKAKRSLRQVWIRPNIKGKLDLPISKTRSVRSFKEIPKSRLKVDPLKKRISPPYEGLKEEQIEGNPVQVCPPSHEKKSSWLYRRRVISGLGLAAIAAVCCICYRNGYFSSLWNSVFQKKTKSRLRPNNVDFPAHDVPIQSAAGISPHAGQAPAPARPLTYPLRDAPKPTCSLSEAPHNQSQTYGQCFVEKY
jgi:hypothetical protein